ncbi:hypothetical protein Hanom_Chr03g00231301 [Helianthus anomalus]
MPASLQARNPHRPPPASRAATTVRWPADYCRNGGATVLPTKPPISAQNPHRSPYKTTTPTTAFRLCFGATGSDLSNPNPFLTTAATPVQI